MGDPTATGPGDLFAGGPPLKLQFKLGLAAPDDLHVAKRVLLFVLVSWVPLLVLAGVEGNMTAHRGQGSFIADFGAMGRYLVAGPLLLVAEATSIAVLGRLALRFADLVRDEERGLPRFQAALDSLRRWRDATLAEVAVVVIAFALGLTAIRGIPLDSLPAWHRAGADGATLSLAGRWAALVSLPLLLILLLGWVWRLFLWTRLLVVVSRIDLDLVAVHPDKAAGLAFLGYSLRAFCLVGTALGAIFAGAIANEVVHGGASLVDYKYTIGGLVVFVVVLFTAPLLAFSLKLAEVWRRGVQQYDQLATMLALHFEREWFVGTEPRPHDDVLERGDFSAATDLFQVVDRVHALSILPVDLLSVGVLAVATLLPFVPVVFLAFPLDEVLGVILGLVH